MGSFRRGRRWLDFASFGLLSVLVVGQAPVARAAWFAINNGGAPPAPANVLGNATHALDRVVVRNVGCGLTTPPIGSCASPGAPTTVELKVGGVVDWLYAYDSSVLVVTGGVTSDTITTNDDAVATISGGRHDGVVAWDDSHVTITGGAVRDVNPPDEGTLIVSGGVHDNLYHSFGTVILIGDEFALDGVPLPFGPIEFGPAGHFLSGKLASGTWLHTGTTDNWDIELVQQTPDIPVIADGLHHEYTDSQLEFAARSFEGTTSVAVLGAGRLGEIYAEDAVSVVLSGSALVGSVVLGGSANADVSGNARIEYQLFLDDIARAHLGASVEDTYVRGDAEVIVGPGADTNVILQERARLEQDGGIVVYDGIGDQSTVEIRGGSYSLGQTRDQSQVVIRGGQATIDPPSLCAFHESEIVYVGPQFQLNGQAIAFGVVEGSGQMLLTGTLESGEHLSKLVSLSCSGTIRVAPQFFAVPVASAVGHGLLGIALVVSALESGVLRPRRRRG